MVQFLYWIPSDGNPILSLFNFYLSQCHIFETSPKISFLQHLGLIPTSYFLDDWDFSQMRCPLLSQMSWFFWKWMDWDKEWCKCFGSVSWCPKGIGKICRGLKKIFNIIWSFFGFKICTATPVSTLITLDTCPCCCQLQDHVLCSITD